MMTFYKNIKTLVIPLVISSKELCLQNGWGVPDDKYFDENMFKLPPSLKTFATLDGFRKALTNCI